MYLKEQNGAELFCRKTEPFRVIVPDCMMLGHRRHKFAFINMRFSQCTTIRKHRKHIIRKHILDKLYGQISC